MTGMVDLTRATIRQWLRRYHRHEITLDAAVPDTPVLFVANHGFGGVIDLNAAASFAVIDDAGVTRDTTTLVHQVAWTFGIGEIVEAFGGVVGSAGAVADAFAAERNVLVFPGGDVDAGKSWWDRNEVRFDGRSGFARIAMEHGVPIVPIVTAGAGDTLFVIHDGRGLSRRLGIADALRLKTLPISLSIPWGLSIGVVGMVPYFPLPAKLKSALLPAMYAEPDESAADFALRVQAVMQDRLSELAGGGR